MALVVTLFATSDLLVPVVGAGIAALLSGSLITALVSVRDAPTKSAVQLAEATTDHAAELRQDNTELRALNDQLQERLDVARGELEKHRQDAAHDRELGRQYREANEALRMRIDELEAQCARKGIET